jgi:hypothetical protein
VSEPLVDYSDSAEAIKGASVLHTYTDEVDFEGDFEGTEVEKGSYIRDPWYQKDYGTIGYVADDYANETPASRIVQTTITYLPDKLYSPYNYSGYREAYMLMDTETFSGLKIKTGANGKEIQGVFKNVSDDSGRVFYKDAENNEIGWDDLGFTGDITDYVFANVKDIVKAIDKSKDITKKFYFRRKVTFIMLLLKGGDEDRKAVGYKLDIERIDGRSIEDVVNDTASFHLVHSIPVEELSGESDMPIPIKEFVLDSLSTRETLDDIGLMRDTGTRYDYVTDYNKRIHAVISKKEMPDSDALSLSCPSHKLRGEEEPEDLEIIYGAFVEVHENNQYAYKTIPATNSLTGFLCTMNSLVYFAYPNPNATRLVIATGTNVQTGRTWRLYEVKLNRHKLMNTAYAFNNW